jgi:mannose-6-phosphate isomerase-like protein (cupin superfamily)
MIIHSYTTLPETDATGSLKKITQFESDRMFVDYYLLGPGGEQKAHTHADNDKLYFVLEGEGIFLIGEEEHRLAAGEGCVAEAGVPHGVRNDSALPLVLLVSMAPHPGRRS